MGEEHNFKKESFLEFLADAHKNTYAAPKEIKKQYRFEPPWIPGHKEYEFVSGDFKYHDSYAGSEMAPGSEVIFYKDKPVWRMSYQGKTADGLSPAFIDDMFDFLKLALRVPYWKTPFRGPESYEKDAFKYTFEFTGDYTYFKGTERIFYKGQEMFFQDVMGSIVK